MAGITGCEKMAEYYIGLNLQPKINKSECPQGLNVFGVIKTGPNLDTINHIFEVQQLIAINESYDSIEISNASLFLKRIESNGSESFFRPSNSHNGLYFDPSINTNPGDVWYYNCSYDTAIVTASCIVPNTPQLVGDIAISGSNELIFTLKEDITAFMYHVYILSEKNFFIEKRIPLRGVNTSFSIKPNWDLTLGDLQVYVFAYDQNLETYSTTSNTFYKPNSFRPPFSVVNGGFGVFGAISSSLFVVEN